MKLAQWLAELPDDARCAITVGSGDLTIGELREALALPPDRLVTTGGASSELGYSADTWREWADEGKIPGAFRDAPDGYWRLPLAACRDHIEGLRHARKRRQRLGWDASAASEKPEKPQPARKGLGVVR